LNSKKTALAMILSMILIFMSITLFNIQSAKSSQGKITVPDDYLTIHDAINAANQGDVIFVRNGTYHENVVIQKRVLVRGENKNTTIVDGNGAGTVFYVGASDDVEISGFTIRNGDYGVHVATSLRGNISGNVVINHRFYGVFISDSDGVIVDGNTVSNNSYYGLFIRDSCNIILRNNSLTMSPYNFGIESELCQLPHFIHDIDESNIADGKPLYYWIKQRDKQAPSNAGFVAAISSTNITVENLSLSKNGYGVLFVNTTGSSIRNNDFSNDYYGVYLLYSNFNSIENNLMFKNSDGINNLMGSGYNNISNNIISDNGGYGILFHGPGDDRNTITGNIIKNNGLGFHFGGFSYYNNISKNLIVNNGVGMSMDFSSSNTFSENTVAYNGVGASFWGTSENVVFHNDFFKNQRQAGVIDVTDLWDNGYPSGGNYWSDYNGTDLHSGPYQNETSPDGIGDTPYIIDGNNRDRYPLINPYREIPQDSVPPVTINDYDDLWHAKDFTITLTVTDNLSGVAETCYKINDSPTQNVSLQGQPFITLESGNNILVYWSIDKACNEEDHHILAGIKLDKTAPTIGIPSREPAGDVQPDESVKVSVNVSDALSRVKNVTLYYNLNNGTTWEPLPMNYNLSTNIYEAAIPGQPADTWVKYKIIAYDNANNNATLAETQPYCCYQVIPEFPSQIILPLFMITTLIAVIILHRRKQPYNCSKNP